MIKGISFDLWNTLIFTNPNYKKQRNEILSSISNKSVQEIDDIFKAVKNDIDSTVENFGIQYDIIDAYNLLSNYIGINSDKIRNICEDLFIENPPVVRENVLEVLQQIKDLGIKRCISSNTVLISGNVLYRTLQKLKIGDYINNYVFSDQIGYSKPNYKFYYKVQTELHMLKQHTLHVGDNMETDTKGAMKYGFKTMPLFVDADFKTVLERIEFFNNK